MRPTGGRSGRKTDNLFASQELRTLFHSILRCFFSHNIVEIFTTVMISFVYIMYANRTPFVYKTLHANSVALVYVIRARNDRKEVIDIVFFLLPETIAPGTDGYVHKEVRIIIIRTVRLLSFVCELFILVRRWSFPS